MPIDDVSETLGYLKGSADRAEKLLDIVRQDQISARREMDFVKNTTVETREMMDATAPVIAQHNEKLAQIMPLIQTLENIHNGVDTGKRVGKWTVRGALALGSVGAFPKIFEWLERLHH